MTVEILVGDVMDKLAELPDESVQCAVTSPPYYGLRCYDAEGQIGLEATPEAHIARLVEVFREVRRVLRADGVLWLNYGDAYASSGQPGYQALDKLGARLGTGGGHKHSSKPVGRAPTPAGLKPKDLLMLPARVALALQADGWWLRSMLPWVKRSAMPESVTDRPATAIEYVFLLTKSGETTFWQHRDGGATNRQPEPDYRWIHKETGQEVDAPPEGWNLTADKTWRRVNLWRGRDYFYDAEAVRQGVTGTANARRKDGEPPYSHDGGGGFDNRQNTWKETYVPNARNFRNSDLFYASLAAPHGLICGADGEPLALDVNPAGFAEAHFATFPPKLIEPLIKAGSSEKGCCAACGAPWVRKVTKSSGGQTGASWHNHNNDAESGNNKSNGGQAWKTYQAGETLGWSPSCDCENSFTTVADDPVPCTILDPFGGAGTTGLVAGRLGRNAVLIELNPDYAAMARKRIDTDAATRGTGPAETMRGDDLPLFQP